MGKEDTSLQQFPQTPDRGTTFDISVHEKTVSFHFDHAQLLFSLLFSASEQNTRLIQNGAVGRDLHQTTELMRETLLMFAPLVSADEVMTPKDWEKVGINKDNKTAYD